jgi:site-specific recombinase XerD
VLHVESALLRFFEQFGSVLRSQFHCSLKERWCLRCIEHVKQLGSRLGNWLTNNHVKLLLQNADGDDLRSLRDLAMVAVLLGCGLRRAELSALQVEDLQIRQEAGKQAIVPMPAKFSFSIR